MDIAAKPTGKRHRNLVIATLLPWLAAIGFFDGAVVFAQSSECKPASISQLENEGKISAFEIRTTCSLPGISESNLLELYRSQIGSRSNIQLIGEKSAIDSSGSLSMQFDIIESVYTAHGDMTIYGKINITRGSPMLIRYTHKSGKIEATGAAASTRSVTETAELRADGDAHSMQLSKLLQIKKPWYAPTPLFKREVYKGLRRDMNAIIERHLSVLE